MSFELAKKAYGYVKAIWPWILKQWADFQGLPSSQKGLVLGALGLLAVFVLAAAGAAFLFFEGPLLLNIRKWPVLFTNATIAELIPKKIEGQPQILVHRKVLHLNYWTVAKNMDDCKLKKPVGLCDEARIVDSWTFIVPESSSVELMARGYINEGEYGRMQGMTDHYIQQISGLDDKKHPVYSIRIHDPKRIGELDVALVDRVVRGGFQPDPKNNLGLKACVEDAVGIFFSGPTGSAELFVVLETKRPKPSSFRIWKAVGLQKPQEIPHDEARQEEVRFVGENRDRIYWKISKNLMEHFVKKDTMLWLGWQWAEEIKSPYCLKPR